MTLSVGDRARGASASAQNHRLRCARRASIPVTVHLTRLAVGADGRAHHMHFVVSSIHNKDKTMTTMIKNEYIQDNGFASIDLSRLSAITGGKDGENGLQRWGENMQKGGEYALAAGAVGTVVP